eukprot:TRINITY_DN6647_c0_g1_i2.p1 TRINITY_DN6647_c0_g1~~TRINITY_DN6647_c0_g1_i2.p1  ORF type:complete len:921 (+),score=178.28 TRINITY_DN6647_c0_g1_i2:117-2765(+)
MDGASRQSKVEGPSVYRFRVHTFERAQDDSGRWVPTSLVFGHAQEAVCTRWADRLLAHLRADERRPRKLLVIVNPFGGTKQGLQKWRLVEPIFQRAQVETQVVLTERQGHAFDLMDKASEESLQERDGVVVVGGDGLFNEVLNGLALRRHAVPPAPMPYRRKKKSNGPGSRRSTTSDEEEAWAAEAHVPVSLVTGERTVELVSPRNVGRKSSEAFLQELTRPLMYEQAAPLSPRAAEIREKEAEMAATKKTRGILGRAGSSGGSGQSSGQISGQLSAGSRGNSAGTGEVRDSATKNEGHAAPSSAATLGIATPNAPRAPPPLVGAPVPFCQGDSAGSGNLFENADDRRRWESSATGSSSGSPEATLIDAAAPSDYKHASSDTTLSSPPRLNMGVKGARQRDHDGGQQGAGQLADREASKGNAPTVASGAGDGGSGGSRGGSGPAGEQQDGPAGAFGQSGRREGNVGVSFGAWQVPSSLPAGQHGEGEQGRRSPTRGSPSAAGRGASESGDPSDGGFSSREGSQKAPARGFVLAPNAGLLPGKRKLRIGIIPAGSTDTIVISTTGTRDAVTAALHIVLGDRMPLDCLRITSWGHGQSQQARQREGAAEEAPPVVRYAASFCGYGFYGDVIKESEKYRWMGPARYDYAGMLTYCRHRSYEAEVWYLEMPSGAGEGMGVPHGPWPGGANGTIGSGGAKKGFKSSNSRVVCKANCMVCASGQDFSHLGADLSSDEGDGSHHGKAAPGGLQAPESSLSIRTNRGPFWKRAHGNLYHSVGAAIMSCRNDKAPDGMAAHAHLADGQAHLILIRPCSRPMYLLQLLRMTWKGADPLDFSFVEYHKTPAFTFVSHNRESIWQVDGELFQAHQLSAQVFRGLVDVFARGPEN